MRPRKLRRLAAEHGAIRALGEPVKHEGAYSPALEEYAPSQDEANAARVIRGALTPALIMPHPTTLFVTTRDLEPIRLQPKLCDVPKESHFMRKRNVREAILCGNAIL